MTTLLVIDTETTGPDPDQDEPVEVASVFVVYQPTVAFVQDYACSLVRGERPISLEAMAVHHITKAERARGIDEVRLPRADYYVAHNAEFDRRVLRGATPEDAPWICTWRCARHLWEDAPSHKNQVLRYWLPGLNDEVSSAPAMQLPPHRALPDAWVTAHVLMRLLALRSPEELRALTEQPVLLRRVRGGELDGTEWSRAPLSYCRWMTERAEPGSDEHHTAFHWLNSADREPLILETVRFGKHRDQRWADLPSDYLRWLLGQDFDADVRHTAQTVLASRQSAQGVML